jgi:AcrR family transcriptional regulator
MKGSNNIKNPQSQETANRIFNQALRIFLKKGYHGTSIDDITKAARLSKGALYWHFKGKEALLRKIIEEFEKSFLDQMIHTVGKIKGGALDKIEKYIRFNSAFAYYNRELCVSFETLAGELIGTHHRIEANFKRIYKKYQQFLSDLIIQGKKEGVFKKELNTDLAALAIMAFHHGVLVQWSINRDNINGEIFVKTFKEIMFNGLLA